MRAGSIALANPFTSRRLAGCRGNRRLSALDSETEGVQRQVVSADAEESLQLFRHLFLRQKGAGDNPRN